MMENGKREIEVHRKRMEMLIGAAAGLGYSFLAWGIDAIQLMMHHGSVPWLKFAIGTPLVVMMFIAAAWLSGKTNNLILRMFVWIGAAIAVSVFVAFITFRGTENALKALYPDVASQIHYMLLQSVRGRLFIILVMSIILFLIGGMLFESAVESLVKASGIVGCILPTLVCLAFFGGAGYVADDNFNLILREQVRSVDTQIDEASELHQNNPTKRQEKLIYRFTKLNVNFDRPRRLLVENFDETFYQSSILINFDGTWARCTTMSGTVGNCERITS